MSTPRRYLWRGSKASRRPSPWSGFRALRAQILEHFRRNQHRVANQWRAHVAEQVEDRLSQFVLGPALATSHAQMDRKLGLATGRRVGDHRDQRARLEIEPRPGPQRPEDRLAREVNELLHL